MTFLSQLKHFLGVGRASKTKLFLTVIMAIPVGYSVLQVASCYLFGLGFLWPFLLALDPLNMGPFYALLFTIGVNAVALILLFVWVKWGLAEVAFTLAVIEMAVFFIVLSFIYQFFY